jgi:pilus assembly protein CpaB
MRREVVIALGLAGLSGLFAATGISSWLSSEHARILKSQPAPAPTVEMTQVVVAKEELKYGTQVSRDKLDLAEWPVKNVPRGSFKSIQEFYAQQQRRIVLEPIQANEPILNGKVTGPGQRVGVATMLEAGKKAVTIKVNEVVGVGGLVLPGDRVDIFVTNDGKGDEKKDGSEAQPYTDVLLQDIRVLAIDQIHDPKRTEPVLGRTVTVETSLSEAQKITLASAIGNLTLVLRESSVFAQGDNCGRVTVADLSGNSGEKLAKSRFETTNAVASEAGTGAPDASEECKGLAKVTVVRATAQAEYSVLKRSTGE